MAQAELLPEVTKFIEAPKMTIDGKAVDAISGKTFSVYDPSTGQVFAEVPEAGVPDVDEGVAAARRAFEDRRWSGIRPGKRTEILMKIADLIKRNLNELAQLEALDSGKPLQLASGEMWAASEAFRYFAGWPTKIYGETNPTEDGLFVYT
ncbi:MAG: aldehyde dehydrogenase family protein, partial [Actinomycetota bacterium]|nr:aldehyde dehydrogenase family protein [Actinomycetota bacterium]